MYQQDTWKQHQQQQQWRGLRLGETGSISGKIDKQHLEPNTVNLLYPTQHNTNNIFALLATADDNEDDEKRQSSTTKPIKRWRHHTLH